MRFHHGAIVVASFFFTWDLVLAAPTGKRGILDPLFEISTLGGMTFKINQIPNHKFSGARKGRGAMAMAKAYSKYGTPVPDDLVSYLEQLLEELGLIQKPGAGNNTSAGPQGEK
jgi:hypothetical protein